MQPRDSTFLKHITQVAAMAKQFAMRSGRNVSTTSMPINSHAHSVTYSRTQAAHMLMGWVTTLLQRIFKQGAAHHRYKIY